MDESQPALSDRFSIAGDPIDLTVGQAIRIERPLDLMRPEYRGPIAEAIVAYATGGTRDEGWGYDPRGARAPDVRMPEGVTIEVKASGDAGPWGPTGRVGFSVPKSLRADVLVFAYLAGGNALDLHAWSFHVLLAGCLTPGQFVPLARARSMSEPVRFPDLRAAIGRALHIS